MTDRQPISTAPRDGRSIIVGDEDAGEFIMRWDAEFKNGLVPGAVGFWVGCDNAFTWSEHDGHGPTFWRHLNS